MGNVSRATEIRASDRTKGRFEELDFGTTPDSAARDITEIGDMARLHDSSQFDFRAFVRRSL